jgi:hypothetical protein
VVKCTYYTNIYITITNIQVHLVITEVVKCTYYTDIYIITTDKQFQPRWPLIKLGKLFTSLNLSIKRKFQQWWLTIPSISTKQNINTYLKSLNTKIRPQLMMLKIQFLPWDRHKHVAELNWLMGSLLMYVLYYTFLGYFCIRQIVPNFSSFNLFYYIFWQSIHF